MVVGVAAAGEWRAVEGRKRAVVGTALAVVAVVAPVVRAVAAKASGAVDAAAVGGGMARERAVRAPVVGATAQEEAVMGLEEAAMEEGTRAPVVVSMGSVGMAMDTAPLGKEVAWLGRVEEETAMVVGLSAEKARETAVEAVATATVGMTGVSRR